MKDAPLQLLARNGPLADLHIPREDAFSRYRLHSHDSLNLYTIRPPAPKACRARKGHRLSRLRSRVTAPLALKMVGDNRIELLTSCL